jgi:Protein of unknown function (DUF2637)
LTTEHHSPAAPQRVLGDSPGERRIVAIIGSSVLALALTGMYVSFRTVYAYVLPYFHGTAWAVPSGVDLAILVFSAADLMLMYWDIPMPGLRLVPWAFTAATIALNWQSGGPLPIRIAHAAMPSLWVVFCEYARHVIRHRVGLVAGTRMEKIRKSRWLLAPWSTARMWRRMILWEITNYRAGLDMEADRLTRRALLELEYGRRWRRKAPATKLLPLKLGALAPADTLGELTRTGLLDLDFGAIDGGRTPDRSAPGADHSDPDPSVRSRRGLPEGEAGSGSRRAIPAPPAQPQAALPPPQPAPAPEAEYTANAVNGAYHAPVAYNGHQVNGNQYNGQHNGQVNGQVNGFATAAPVPGSGSVPGPGNVSGFGGEHEQDHHGQDHQRRERDRDRDRMAARHDPQPVYDYDRHTPNPVAQVPEPRRPEPSEGAYPATTYPAARPERTRHDLEVRFAAPPAREEPDHDEPEDDQDDGFDEDFAPIPEPAEPTVVIGKQRQQFEEELDRMIREGDFRILSPDMRQSTAAAWEAAATLDLALATERAFRYGSEYRERKLAQGITMEMADAMGVEYNGDQ